jgi:hypothetical protein
VPLVRCAKHGRVYDDSKDAGCSVCVQEASMPRAPGSSKTVEPDAEGAKSRGMMLLLGILVVVGVAAGGFYRYTATHNDQTRAQATRDSLRALGAAPAGPDTTKYAAPNDYGPIRRARSLKAGLEGMLHGSRAAVLGWAAGTYDTAATDRAEKRRAKQYDAFQKHWHDRLDAMTRGGTEFRYAPGVRYTEQMENVTNQLQAALSVMRDMVRKDSVKPKAERVADMTAATGYLRAAGTVLTNLPR